MMFAQFWGEKRALLVEDVIKRNKDALDLKKSISRERKLLWLQMVFVLRVEFCAKQKSLSISWKAFSL